MKKRYYIFTAIASYIILLVATIPARLVTDQVGDSGAVTIQGVSGTLWNGNAVMITLNKDTQLTNTNWSFTVWRLLLGQIAADINTRYLGNDISTEFGASFLGRFFINDLSAEVSADDVAQLANIPLAQLSGLISVNIEHAQWKQGELPQASGEIIWKDASITVTDTASLGNVFITLGESEKQLLGADIKNQGGDIKISGTAELVPEADYAVNIKLLPAASASNNIKQSLGLFAKKQKNGEYLFRNSGPLEQIGLL